MVRVLPCCVLLIAAACGGADSVPLAARQTFVGTVTLAGPGGVVLTGRLTLDRRRVPLLLQFQTATGVSLLADEGALRAFADGSWRRASAAEEELYGNVQAAVAGAPEWRVTLQDEAHPHMPR